MEIRFAECVFDNETRELRVNGKPRDLSPRCFDLLRCLIESRPRAFGKDELMERLWPGEIVSESSLPRLVAELRSALGDDAKAPRFVKTHHTFGYSFVAVVSEARPTSAPFHLVWGERRIPLSAGENVVGRAETARVSIDLQRVSRSHAKIVVEGGQASLEDLSSKNGTFLRGKRIEGRAALQDGDEIMIGPATLIFRSAPTNATTQTGSMA